MQFYKLEKVVRMLVVLMLLVENSSFAFARNPGTPTASDPQDRLVESWNGGGENAELNDEVASPPLLQLAPEVADLPDLIPPGFSVIRAENVDGVETAVVNQNGGVITFSALPFLLIVDQETVSEEVTISLSNQNAFIQEAVSLIPGTLFGFELSVKTSAGEMVSKFERPFYLAADLRQDIQSDQAAESWFVGFQESDVIDAWISYDATVYNRAGLISVPVRDLPSAAMVIGTRTKPTPAPESRDNTLLTGPIPDDGSPSPWRYQWEAPSVSEFSGAAMASYPIALPPGRAGLQPNIDISYTSRAFGALTFSDGMDQGALGLGWSFNQIEISRDNTKLVSDGATYLMYHGAQFSLVLNGQNHRLIWASTNGNIFNYYAENAPQLRVQQIYAPTAANINRDRVYWLVQTPDGTTYRLGYTEDAETGQQATYLMTQDAHKQSAGFQGNYGGLRWRVDTMTDVHGNQIQYDYHHWDEETERYTIINYNDVTTSRSRISQIRYNYENLAANTTTRVTGNFATRIDFIGFSPLDSANPKNIKLFHLDFTEPYKVIVVELESAHLGNNNPCGQGGRPNELYYVIGIQEQNADGSRFLPRTDFSYEILTHNSRRPTCNRFKYLSAVDNGYGGRVLFNYTADGRAGGADPNVPTYGQTHFVHQKETWDGIHTNPAVSTYGYASPCYNQLDGDQGTLPGSANCPTSDTVWPYDYPHGALVGFSEVTIINYGYDGAILNEQFVQFRRGLSTDINSQEYRGKLGRPYLSQLKNAAGFVLKQVDTTYFTDKGAAFDFTYERERCEMTAVPGGQSSTHCKTQVYGRQNNIQYGNLTRVEEEGYIGGTADQKRLVYREYFPNTTTWVIGAVAREAVYTGSSGVPINPANSNPISEVLNYYDANNSWAMAPGIGNLRQVEKMMENGIITIPPSPTPPATPTNTPSPSPTPNPTVPGTIVLTPDADAYVSDLFTNRNNGDSIFLLAFQGPFEYHYSYLRFNIPTLNGSISNATLRLFVDNSSEISTDNFTLHQVNDNNWNENLINFNNAPAMEESIATMSVSVPGTWIEIDVTDYVSGQGAQSFGISPNSSNALLFHSKENVNPAELIIVQGAAATPTNTPMPPTPTSTTTPTATATNSPSVTPTNTPSPPSTATQTPSPTISPTETASPTPPPAPGTPFVLTPDADALVFEDSYGNFGANPILRVDATENQSIHSYLRFNVPASSGPVNSASLRLYVMDSNLDGFTLHQVSDNSWVESEINYFNAPTVETAISTIGSTSKNSWVEIDVTSYVTGPGLYSFALTSETLNSLRFNSKEYVNPPELIIEPGSGSNPTPTVSPTPSATIVPTNTPIGGSSIDLTPEADALVLQNSQGNFGDDPILRVSAITNQNIYSYIRFEVPNLNLPVGQATLRLYALDSNVDGFNLHQVLDNTWQESDIDYYDAPEIGPTITTDVPTVRNNWVEVDVTSFITGQGAFSFALTSDTLNSLRFHSKEHANPPELIIEAGGIATSIGTSKSMVNSKPGRGLAVKPAYQSPSATFAVVQRFNYDAYGNAIRIFDANNYEVSTEFDDFYHLYPVLTQNELGHTQHFGYYDLNANLNEGPPPNWGANTNSPPGTLREVQDPNGLWTYYTYDDFGRLLRVYRGYDGEPDQPSEAYGYGDNQFPSSTDKWTKTQNNAPAWTNGGIWERTFYDGLGHPIQEQIFNWDEVSGERRINDTFYNAAGQIIAQSDPYLRPQDFSVNNFVTPDTNVNRVITSYDAANQAVQTVGLDGAVSSVVHGRRALYQQDANNYIHASFFDAVGQLTAVDELINTFDDNFEENLNNWSIGNGVSLVNRNDIENQTQVAQLIDTSSSGDDWNHGRIRRIVPVSQDSHGDAITFSFRVPDGNAFAQFGLVHGTWGAADYRRWGLIVEQGNIKLQEWEGDSSPTNETKTPLLTLQEDTWYRVMLRTSKEIGQYFSVVIWERDNPAVFAEHRADRSDNQWLSGSWAFVVRARQFSTVYLDDYTELNVNRTSYEYDLMGNLTHVVDPHGYETEIIYDAAGRKRYMDDPDMGKWYYAYDNAGNLTSQTDNKNQTIIFEYDELNRLKAKRLGSGGPLLASFSFDDISNGNKGVGLRTGMTAYDPPGQPNNSASWHYDDFGRVIQENRIVAGNNYRFGFAYTQGNLPVSITYPGGANGEIGESVTTNYYWATGQPKTLIGDSSYVNNASYWVHGNIAQLRFTGSVYINFSYDIAHRLNAIDSVAPSGQHLRLRYEYDPVGNIDSMFEISNSWQWQYYTYDSLNRLIHAETSNVGYGRYNDSYRYDALGNLINKAGVAMTFEADKPHAVSTWNGQDRYDYDDNGNMIRRNDGSNTWTLLWTPENMLHSASGTNDEDFRFVYDADGMMVQRLENEGELGETVTVHLGKLFEHNLTLDSYRKQYLFNGQLVAARDGLAATDTMNYFLTDVRGSVATTLYADGTVKAEMRYKPFGEERFSNNITPTGHRFTSQRWDDGLGLYDYNARYYDPGNGRFISADTLVPTLNHMGLTVDLHNEILLNELKENSSGDGAFIPQGLNRYSYVRNNPINLVDPSGHNEILLQAEITSEQASELLNGISEAINVLEEAEDIWNLHGLPAAIGTLLAGLGLSELLKQGLSAKNLASAALKHLRNLSPSTIFSATLLFLQNTIGEVSIGTAAASIISSVLIPLLIISIILLSGTHIAVNHALKTSIGDLREIRRDLSWIKDESEKNNTNIFISVEKTSWYGHHQVNYSTANISATSDLNFTLLQPFGYSTKDAILVSWPSIFNS